MKKILLLILAALVFSPTLSPAAARKDPKAAATATTAAAQQKIDLNRASVDDLVGVPGIGPQMAQAIVDLRSKKGALKRVEELLEVSGIKEKKLAALTAYLEVTALQESTLAQPAPQSK